MAWTTVVTRSAAVVAAFLLAACTGPAAPPDAGPSSTGAGPGTGPGTRTPLRGVNWADPRDNYASDALVLSGLEPTDSYDEVSAFAGALLDGLDQAIGADLDVVRLPLNPATTSTPWWDSYRGAIDALTARGVTVILGYWESDAAKDGTVDDPAAWSQMWDTAVAAYGDNDLVWFEPMNEPFGYAPAAWVDLCAQWLADHPDVPRERVVVSGTGYNDDVTTVGAAAELDGTRLSLHLYSFWAEHTEAERWTTQLESRIGDYAARTIIDEAGSPMATGLNYGASDGNVATAYLAALSRYVRQTGVGLVYWPGLRTGDSYSLLAQDDAGGFGVTNDSGLARLRWAWGLIDDEPVNDLPPAQAGAPIRTGERGLCLDVPGVSTEPGTPVSLWDCNGGENQSWSVAEDAITVYGGTRCLQAGEGSGAAGEHDVVVIAECAAVPGQVWAVGDEGTIRSGDLCLTAVTVSGGARVEVAACAAAGGQAWTTG